MKQKIHYTMSGVCSEYVDITVEDDRIGEVCFEGGCQGNLQGIALLVRGMKIDDVIDRLEGVRCGGKATSCPDQFTKALRKLKEKGE